jgi:hypothetical protein
MEKIDESFLNGIKIIYYKGFNLDNILNHSKDGSDGMMVVFFNSDAENKKFKRDKIISNILEGEKKSTKYMIRAVDQVLCFSNLQKYLVKTMFVNDFMGKRLISRHSISVVSICFCTTSITKSLISLMVIHSRTQNTGMKNHLMLSFPILRILSTGNEMQTLSLSMILVLLLLECSLPKVKQILRLRFTC